MSKIADEMLRDIEKNVVKFAPNFDNRLREPTVLPSRIPNLLVNGSVGIAVGMATNIPPHNLGEVIDAAIYRMENPECTVEDLIDYIPGPDFPTKAIIYGKSGILQAYRTGAGRIYVRARAEVNEDSTVSIILIENVNGEPQVKVIARDFMSNMSSSTEVVVETLSREYIKSTLSNAGISAELIDFSQSALPPGTNPQG